MPLPKVPQIDRSQVIDSKWWPETGSNRRRRPFQGRALPLSYLASVQLHNCRVGLLRGVRPTGGNTALLQQLLQYSKSASSRQFPASPQSPTGGQTGPHVRGPLSQPPAEAVPVH
jgi:hypothetical protein